jgi:hypothetical protein
MQHTVLKVSQFGTPISDICRQQNDVLFMNDSWARFLNLLIWFQSTKNELKIKSSPKLLGCAVRLAQ